MEGEVLRAWDGALLFTAIAAVLISILGFFGNLLTILALPYSLRLRNAATWFVVNLAVAEGIFCVTILPMSAAHIFTLYVTDGRPLFDEEGCSVFVFLRYINIQAELLSIAAIAVNRCVLIAAPKTYPKLFTTRKTAGVIAAIWVLSIAIMLIPLLNWYGSLGYNRETQECDFLDDGRYGAAPRKVFLAIGFFLPCVVVIASYSYIFYKARQSAVKVQERTNKSLNSSEVRNTRPAEGLRSREIRIARTIGVIFLVFLMCCSPVSIVHFLYAKIQTPNLLLLLHPLYWLQYCLNLFIYVLMNRQYRDAYVNYISRFWPDFRELSRRTFSWKEATSDSGRHGSRANTPSVVRFAARKFSVKGPDSMPGTPTPTPKAATPMLQD